MRYTNPALDGFVEGTPEEVARFLRALKGELPPPVEDVRTGETPTNERILHDYEHDVGLSREARAAYARVVREFQRLIEPQGFTRVTVADVLRFDRAMLSRCSHIQTTGLAGKKKASVARVKCRKGLYGWRVMLAPECNPSCPLFALQRAGPANRLKALHHFYEFLLLRQLVRENPVGPVRRERARTTVTVAGPRKYAPTTEEAQDLLRAARATLTLRDVALLLSLMKWGRRPDHTLEVHAGELRGILPGDERAAVVDFAGVRDRVEQRNGNPRTKLRGNLVSPIDAEFLAFLRTEYLPWRQSRWGFAWNEGPLFPADRAQGAMRYDTLQRLVLDPAMRHLEATSASAEDRERWKQHRASDSKTRITPGCFRHFLSTTLHKFGVPDIDIDILRGDLVAGAKRHYIAIGDEDVHRAYKFPRLLDAGG